MTAKTNAPAAALYFIRAASPLHVGVGEGLGAINLPTAREALTGYPLLPGSSVKGVLREQAESRDVSSEDIWTAFGPGQDRAADARGGLVISDANLLALPVRSLYGTFAYATCPFILRRLTADIAHTGLAGEEIDALKALAQDQEQAVRVTDKGCRLLPAERSDRLLLEDRPIGSPKPDQRLRQAGEWIAQCMWPGENDNEHMRAFFVARLALLPDDLFGHFSRTALEIRYRVRINPDTGTAAGSGPWSEEYMPAETLLHGLILGRRTLYVEDSKEYDDGAPVSPNPERRRRAKRPADALAVLSVLLQDNPLLRFGGKSSGGSGRAQMRLIELNGEGQV